MKIQLLLFLKQWAAVEQVYNYLYLLIFIYYFLPARLRLHKCRRPNERSSELIRFSLLPTAENGHNLRCLFYRFLGKFSGSMSPKGGTVSDRRGILPEADTAESAGRRQRHDKFGACYLLTRGTR
jgi:hypothetical protein